MAHLDLAGVSADGRRLLLQDQQGEEFTLEITPALRAALRGGTTRSAVLENQMTSTLRPREIQTRIRAGETPEAVATAAATTVEAIMPFVAPVLAEREHIAERARKSSLRRPVGDGAGGTRVLGDAVATHLADHQTKIDAVSWDAFRRDDGRWEIAASFATAPRAGTARFTYDPPGNYIVADNDDARWLVGDLVLHSEPRRDDLQQVRERRLAAVPADELPLGDDALDLVTADADADAELLGQGSIDEMLVDVPVQRPVHDDPLRDTTADLTPEPGLTAAEEAAEASKHRRPVAKKRGRASVPSWDEIMFGGSGE
jgi:hypothetical protein